MAASRPLCQEDSVEYRLFPLVPEEIRGKDVDVFLEESLQTYLATLSGYLVDYIWQRDPFQLRVVPETGYVPAHLYGSVCYGDNVEDEWFIVYLLLQLTKDFNGLVVKIQDPDGEFLLIEAAESLPNWVEPETAENRVFLYEGNLHIIPHPKTPAQMASLPVGTPCVADGVACVRQNSSLTVAPSGVQRDIQQRITGYPEKRLELIHRAHCYLPAPLAAILEDSPALIAPMVQAFYYRDPLELKACITFRQFQPGTRVMRDVRFTRCLYAQLVQQQFMPDRRSGYNMPATSNPKFLSYDLGMKLAHGAEILCAKCGKTDEMGNVDVKSKNDPRWQNFVQSLTSKGYFRGKLEGSKHYLKLLDDARNYYYSSTDTSAQSHNPGQLIMDVLRRVTWDIEKYKQQESMLLPPDDNKWLNLSPEELDNMMEKASGRKNISNGNDLGNLADSMKAFVNKVSSFEGAEFPEQDDEVQFDPNSFMQNMQKVFEFEDSDGGSSSGMDEYGSDDDLREYMPKTKNGPASKLGTSKSKNGPKSDDYMGMKDYMEIMDRELSKTTIGQSFEKQQAPTREKSPPKPPPRKKKQSHSNTPQESSPQKQPPPRPSGAPPRPPPPRPPPPRQTSRRSMGEDVYDIDDIDEDFQPVDVDLNVVKNLMESVNSQAGNAGPASNIMGSMGMRMPPDYASELG